MYIFVFILKLKQLLLCLLLFSYITKKHNCEIKLKEVKQPWRTLRIWTLLILSQTNVFLFQTDVKKRETFSCGKWCCLSTVMSEVRCVRQGRGGSAPSAVMEGSAPRCKWSRGGHGATGKQWWGSDVTPQPAEEQKVSSQISRASLDGAQEASLFNSEKTFS